jgi:hypothetical protein
VSGKMNENPDLPSQVGATSSENSIKESVQGDSKQCPCCGNEIKAKARICRFCGARFEIITRGYCATCHKMVEVGDANRCAECGGEVIDLHVVSNLIQSPAPSQPASQSVTAATTPQPGVAPSYPSIEAKTRPGCITIYAILLFLGSASFLCGGIFGSTNPLIESEVFSSLAAGISMGLMGVFMLLLAIGLWRLKNWARIAVIIMQSLAIIGSIFSAYKALTTTSTSLNQNVSPVLTIVVAIIAISLQITILSWFARNGRYFGLRAKYAPAPSAPGFRSAGPITPSFSPAGKPAETPVQVQQTGQTVAQTAKIPPSSPLTDEASALVAEALEIIESKAVQIAPGMTIKYGGDASQAMRAAEILGQAHRLQPEDPWLHYAWASALHLAMQYKTAREEMGHLLTAHPSFHWAKFALDGWDQWDGLFTLPPWEPSTKTVHPAISGEVKRGYVLGTRQGLQPRATLFLRDASGDFQGSSALASMRIDITTVLSDTEPLLAVVYARLWDNPQNPYQVEALGLPLHPRGSKQRCKYEYLCLQEEIDFAIIDNRDRILLNKRLPIPDRMKKAHDDLLNRLSTSAGREYSDMELISAVRAFQSHFALSDVRY